jgi:hypothetical protein
MTEQVPETHAEFFGRHLADTPAGPVVPTQVARPWRATLRTVVEVGIPAFLVLLGVVPPVLETVADGMGAALPPGVAGWLLGTAAVITLAAGTLARIAAIPGVDRLLRAVNLDAAGRGKHSA